LTGGLLVQALARVEGSGDWLAGGVVAYASSVKRQLLRVDAGKVVSAEAAGQMARAVRHLMGADVAVSVTGVAGPARQDDEPPGTVWIGVATDDAGDARLLLTSGAPEEICRNAVSDAIRQILAVVS
jgi:PncC family amidohydrolase